MGQIFNYHNPFLTFLKKRATWTTILLSSFVLLTLRSSPLHAKELPPFRLGIRTQIVSNKVELIPLPPLSKSNKLEFRPAESHYVGITAGYRWLAGTVWFSVPASKEVRAKEGTSRYRDVGLSLYFKHFGMELRYSRFLGYLLENSSVLSQATLAGQEFYKVPDLETLGFGGNFYYVLDPSVFSLSAAFDQSEIQDKSAGSWILIFAGRWQSIENSSEIIPEEKRADFGGDQDIRFARMTNVSAGIGYAYNWVPGGFFISPFLGISFGYQVIRWGLAGAHEGRKGSFAANGHLKLGIGTNVENFFLTLDFSLDRFQQNTNSIEIGNVVTSATFSIGARF